jgi:hypothetical protein
MSTLDTARDIKNRCIELRGDWTERNDAMEDWYDILLMEQDPAVRGPREQYVGNDPRTFFNLARYLFISADVKHLLNTTLLTENQKTSADSIQALIDRGWRDNDRRNRRLGHGSWLAEFSGLLFATGWYSLFVMPFEDKLLTEIWNPYQVFPCFSDTDIGVDEVARIYNLTVDQARNKASRQGWKVPKLGLAGNSKIDVYSYLGYTNEGVVYQSVVMHNELVHFRIYPEIEELPVLVGPGFGLPDRGIIDRDSDWKRNLGESIFASNEQVYKQLNRSMTHMQQVLRDTAQPPLIEKKGSPGGKGIVDENKIFTRAYVMRMSQEDDVSALALPGIPPEVTQHLFNINAQRQRGSVPDLAFGNIQQSNLSALMINQVAGIAQNILQGYLDATISVLSEVDERWTKGVLKGQMKPYGWTKAPHTPKPEEIEFDVDFRIKLPGDLAARATIARMIDPEFNLDTEDTISLIFPEIKDPTLAVAKSRADRAMRSELAEIVNLILAYETEAELLAKENPRASALYKQAAEKLSTQLETPKPQPPGPPGGAMPMPNAQAVPSEMFGG